MHKLKLIAAKDAKLWFRAFSKVLDSVCGFVSKAFLVAVAAFICVALLLMTSSWRSDRSPNRSRPHPCSSGGGGTSGTCCNGAASTVPSERVIKTCRSSFFTIREASRITANDGSSVKMLALKNCSEAFTR